MFVPKSIVCLRDYSWKQFQSDFTAGVVVALVALPLAMAFSIACGLPPERGLYTAVVAGFLISALSGSRVAIGGRSFGGRMCSMAAAEGLDVAALVLVSYPLHPPGRPERLRTAHFPALHLPCLFVSGRRDSFASEAELEQETKAIPGPVTIVFVDGDHSLRKSESAVADIVAPWLAGLR